MEPRRVYFASVRDYLVAPENRLPGAIGFERVPDGPPSPTQPDNPVNPVVPSCTAAGAEALMDRLQAFYGQGDNFDKLRQYLERGKARDAGPVSLRILDFLCTENGLALSSDESLPARYQHMLKTYSKAFFDMFARGSKTIVSLKGERLQTTVGQLNFFRWAIETGLLGRIQAEGAQLREGVRKRKRELPEAGKSSGRASKLPARMCFGGHFDPKIIMAPPRV